MKILKKVLAINARIVYNTALRMFVRKITTVRKAHLQGQLNRAEISVMAPQATLTAHSGSDVKENAT